MKPSNPRDTQWNNARRASIVTGKDIVGEFEASVVFVVDHKTSTNGIILQTDKMFCYCCGTCLRECVSDIREERTNKECACVFLSGRQKRFVIGERITAPVNIWQGGCETDNATFAADRPA